jgi:hypothetical protein
MPEKASAMYDKRTGILIVMVGIARLLKTPLLQLLNRSLAGQLARVVDNVILYDLVQMMEEEHMPAAVLLGSVFDHYS